MTADLRSLNREQLEAVLCLEGPLLVLAGAGSGKTRVITYRLAHLIDQGVSPKNILCVTFTNKAAFEMRERARSLVGKSVRGATLSTFHALGSKILREHGQAVGLRPGFSISDAADQLGTLRRILRGLNIDDRRFDPKRILAEISRAKNAGVGSAEYRALGGRLRGHEASAAAPFDEEYAVATIEAYERYEQGLRAQNVVDFDDLLLLTVRLFAADREVLFRLQRRWRYLMIDEYQDTNGAQFMLMQELAGHEKNLCVVGDDDQSIYGWRGADITNILRFEEHFPGARVVKLETNYRSTANILQVANAIIEKNPNRHDKRLRAAAGTGGRVRLCSMLDEEAEAEEVASAIEALIQQGVTPKEIAVLFRSNVQSRPIELALRRAQVPYRVVGGMDLFDRKEIKDALAYLRVLENPDDEQSLRRILNFPPRGIGDTTVERVDGWARERGLPLTAGLEAVEEVPGLPAKAREAIASFTHMLAAHRQLRGRRKPSTIARKLLSAAGLEEALFGSSDSGATALRRVENVREIVRQIERYEERSKSKAARQALAPQPAEDEEDDLFEDDSDVSLGGFLGELALAGFEDGRPKDEREDQIVLSTIHAAKGLEWPHVFVVGVEEELLPHARSMGIRTEDDEILENVSGIEEERRLAYVAVTRARAQLVLSFAESRARFGRLVPRKRSRFLDGLPEEALELSGGMRPERTLEEKEQAAQEWRKKIRAQLGIVD